MRTVALPVLAVAAVALGMPVGYGAPVGDVLLYAGFELCFVVLPGWAAYRLLVSESGGPLRQVALGWALGYVLLIVAFIATAATGTRPLLYVYPLVVLAVAAAVRHRHLLPSGGLLPPGGRLAWALAAACIGAMAYVGFAYFPGAPLPGSQDIAYFIDYPRWISLAAEAMNHWPITDPSVAGEPMPYHYFVNIQLAAASQVTGIDLPLIYFRLFIFPLVVLSILLFAVAGKALTGRYAVGLVAAAIAILIGEIRLDPSATFDAHTPFFGLFFTLLYRSPSFLLGLVFFLPLIMLISEVLNDRMALRRVGHWVLIGLFMVGASDAKVSILPLLVVALLAYCAVVYVRSRKLDFAAAGAAAMALAIFAVLWLIQYRGHSSGLGLDPFADVNLMPAVQLIKGDLAAHIADFPGRDPALDVGAIAFGVLGLLVAPLVGIAWLLQQRRTALGAPQVWLLTVLLAGTAMAFAFAEPGTQSSLYFLFYGIVGGYLLSAHGLVAAWERRPKMEGRWLRFILLAMAFACVVVALVVVPETTDPFSGAREMAITYMTRYGVLVVALVLLYWAGRRWVGPTRWPAAALVTLALLMVGALATPFDNLKAAVSGDSGGVSLGTTLSPDLYAALRWIREDTPTDAVIAVNNPWVDAANTVPLAYMYSAFAERRVFLEGWGYSQRTREMGFADVVTGENPFAGRLALNQATFADADPDAIATLVREFGVRYLLVDRGNGIRSDVAALRKAGEVVYEGPGVLVLRLPAPV